MCTLVLSCDHSNEQSDSAGYVRGSTVYGVTVPTGPNRLHHLPHGADWTLSPSPRASQCLSLSLWISQDPITFPMGRTGFITRQAVSLSPWAGQGLSLDRTVSLSPWAGQGLSLDRTVSLSPWAGQGLSLDRLYHFLHGPDRVYH